MKAFITLAIFCLIASAIAQVNLTEEQKAKVKEYFDACVKQENVSDGDATKLRNKDFANPSNAMKCFGTCIFEKVGTLKDGVVQEAVVMEKFAPTFGEEKVKAALTKCKDIKGSDRCDTGFKLYQCFEQFKA